MVMKPMDNATDTGTQSTTTMRPEVKDPTTWTQQNLTPDAVAHQTISAKGVKTTGTYGPLLQQDIAAGMIKVISSMAPGPSDIVVRGSVLRDEDNYIARPWYEITTDSVRNEIMSLSPQERLLIAQQLKRTGYYKGNDPSESIMQNRGFNNTDIAAFADFMNDANANYKTIRAYLPTIMSAPGYQASGTTVKVTPREDIAYYMQQASLAQLGRMPTKAEIDRAVKSIQQTERSASGGGTTAPSTTVLATAQAQAAAPGERSSYAVGNAINLAFRILSGGG